MAAPQLESELTRQLAQKSLTEQVKGLVKQLLAGQRPTLRDVARELAQQYLLHSSLELAETAYLLGYEDANSFFRAFHQWEGTSPGEWRAAHARRVNSNHASATVA